MIKRDLVRPTKKQWIVIRDGRTFHSVSTCEPHQQFTTGMDCDVYDLKRDAQSAVKALGAEWPEE